MHYGLAASRERPSPLYFLHATFFYLPGATGEITQTTGTKQEVDFRNKSVEFNPEGSSGIALNLFRKLETKKMKIKPVFSAKRVYDTGSKIN